MPKNFNRYSLFILYLVRYVPEQTYITTLNDEDSGRIVALSYVKSGNSNVIVMAGMQLKVWITSSERR